VLVLGVCAVAARWWGTRTVRVSDSIEERVVVPFALGGLQVRVLQVNDAKRGARAARTAPSRGAVVAQEALLAQFGRDPVWAVLTRPARLYWYTQQQAWPSVTALLDTVLHEKTPPAASPAMRAALVHTFRQLSVRAMDQRDRVGARRWADRAAVLARDTLTTPRDGTPFSRRQARDAVAQYRAALRMVLTRFEVEQVGLVDPRRDGARRVFLTFAAQMREFPLAEQDRQFLDGLPGMASYPPPRLRPAWWQSVLR
jgi:hypothetical protein